jgi:hypothetical protein
VCACAPQGADLENPARGGGKADDDSTTPGGLPLLAQSYAIRTDSYLRIHDQTNDSINDLHTYMFLLAIVGQQESWVGFNFQPCRINLPTFHGVQPRFKDALLQSISIGVINGSLSVTDSAVVTSDPFAIQLGVKLDDPLADPVPTDPHDPHVYDQDHDGHPGVAVHASLFRVDLGMRAALSLQGALGADQGLRGVLLNPLLGFEIYGDNVPFVNVHDSVANLRAHQDVLLQQHTFQALPLNGIGTCGDVLAAWSQN